MVPASPLNENISKSIHVSRPGIEPPKFNSRSGALPVCPRRPHWKGLHKIGVTASQVHCLPRLIENIPVSYVVQNKLKMISNNTIIQNGFRITLK